MTPEESKSPPPYRDHNFHPGDDVKQEQLASPADVNPLVPEELTEEILTALTNAYPPGRFTNTLATSPADTSAFWLQYDPENLLKEFLSPYSNSAFSDQTLRENLFAVTRSALDAPYADYRDNWGVLQLHWEILGQIRAAAYCLIQLTGTLFSAAFFSLMSLISAFTALLTLGYQKAQGQTIDKATWENYSARFTLALHVPLRSLSFVLIGILQAVVDIAITRPLLLVNGLFGTICRVLGKLFPEEPAKQEDNLDGSPIYELDESPCWPELMWGRWGMNHNTHWQDKQRLSDPISQIMFNTKEGQQGQTSSLGEDMVRQLFDDPDLLLNWNHRKSEGRALSNALLNSRIKEPFGRLLNQADFQWYWDHFEWGLVGDDLISQLRAAVYSTLKLAANSFALAYFSLQCICNGLLALCEWAWLTIKGHPPANEKQLARLKASLQLAWQGPLRSLAFVLVSIVQLVVEVIFNRFLVHFLVGGLVGMLARIINRWLDPEAVQQKDEMEKRLKNQFENEDQNGEGWTQSDRMVQQFEQYQQENSPDEAETLKKDCEKQYLPALLAQTGKTGYTLFQAMRNNKKGDLDAMNGLCLYKKMQQSGYVRDDGSFKPTLSRKLKQA